LESFNYGILEGLNEIKGGERMTKKNHTHLKNNKNVQPKGEAEFAGEAGLEKVVLQSQKKSK
jgi:hypothetical protein